MVVTGEWQKSGGGGEEWVTWGVVQGKEEEKLEDGLEAKPYEGGGKIRVDGVACYIGPYQHPLATSHQY